jgi:hypothetical protein
MDTNWKNDEETAQGIRAQWHLIRVGDRLEFKTPHGNTLRGRVVFKFGTHCTLNCGGRHGTPGIVDAYNFLRHFKASKQKETA